VIWNRKAQTLDIKEVTVDPADELTIGNIGALLGDNVVTYIVRKTKAQAKI
jgi:hypothetical protein